MQLTRNPHPLGEQFALGLKSARFGRRGLVRALAQGEAGQPRDREQTRGDQELPGAMTRVVVGDDRRGTQSHHQPDSALDRVLEVPEQERGGHPGREEHPDGGHELAVDGREAGCDEPHRQGRGEREAAARQQGEHDAGNRGNGDPRRRPRLQHGVLVQRRLERAFDRPDDDQQVEAIAARQRRDPAHVPNVHRVLGPRLLLEREVAPVPGLGAAGVAGAGFEPATFGL